MAVGIVEPLENGARQREIVERAIDAARIEERRVDPRNIGSRFSRTPKQTLACALASLHGPGLHQPELTLTRSTCKVRGLHGTLRPRANSRFPEVELLAIRDAQAGDGFARQDQALPRRGD